MNGWVSQLKGYSLVTKTLQGCDLVVKHACDRQALIVEHIGNSKEAEKQAAYVSFYRHSEHVVISTTGKQTWRQNGSPSQCWPHAYSSAVSLACLEDSTLFSLACVPENRGAVSGQGFSPSSSHCPGDFPSLCWWLFLTINVGCRSGQWG